MTATAAVVAVVLGGCTLAGGTSRPDASANGTTGTATGQDEDDRPDPRWEQLPSPDSPTDGRLATTVTTMLGADDGSPALLVGSSATNPSAPAATTWAFDDTGWAPTTLPDGEDLTLTTAVDDGTRTWLAGWRWDTQTGVAAALLSSTDRTTWQDETTAGAPDGAYPAALVPAGDALVVLGRTVEEVPFAWRPGDEAAWVPLPLPDEHEGTVLGGVARVDDPDALVALVGAGPPGGTDVPSGVVSDDAGRTWRPGQSLPGTDPGVSGVVAVDGGVVATGWVRADGRTVPTSWSSPDGVTWEAEDVSDEAGLDLSVVPGVDVWLGAPTVRSGTVVAPVSVRGALESFLVERSDDGWADPSGTVPSWRDPGGSPTVVAEGDELLVTQSTSGGVRVRRSVEDDWQEWYLGEVLAVPEVTELVPSADGAVLWTQSEDVDVGPTGAWSRTYLPTLHDVTTDGRVAARPWPGGPDEPDVDALAERLTGAVTATGDDGSTVVLGESPTEDGGGSDVAGWRDAVDGSRRVVEGLAGPDSAWVRAVTQVAGTWYAVGGRSMDTDPSSGATAQAWRSDDGVTWTAMTGDLGSDDEDDSVAQDVCAGPDGQVLAVGGAVVDGTDRAVVWRLDEEAGVARVWASTAEQDARLDACVDATEEGAVLVTGEADGAPTSWTTADGTTFEAAALGSTRTSFGPVRPVTGGFAAAGRTGDGAWTGPVVHLSRDGETWRTLRVPTEDLLAAVDVVALGDDLLVAGDAAGGPQLWRLHDYAAQL